MEVDPPQASDPLPGARNGGLKRCNSAPMINLIPDTSSSFTPVSQPLSSSHNATAPLISPVSRPLERQRTLSASSTSLNITTPPIRIPSRLIQIKQEETTNVVNREVAHEREVQSSMQIAQSWDEFSLEDSMMTEAKRPRSFSEQLHIFTSPFPLSSSPSPTRVGKQCFSPSAGLPIKDHTLHTSPTPSPTRRSFVRSLSPIAMRPNAVGMKRKLDTELCEYISPAKRFNNGPFTPERLLTHHPLMNSISSSSFEDSDPNGARESNNSSTSSFVSNDSGTSMTPQTCFTFCPVQNNRNSESQNSEMTDVSEPEQTRQDDSGNRPQKPTPKTIFKFGQARETQV
ncbi:unnamed protein product [Owenia fusiformis]|uniref:Protein FAM122A n=1 Tax=Owenia fusiformis TaxID=6347 RepID=A0A8S4NGU9_OWEFU|nr:unnamed protein product [Owenia fusiformis]